MTLASGGRSEAAREYLAAAQTAVDAVPPKADGPLTWRNGNALDMEEQTPRLPRMLTPVSYPDVPWYRSFDSPDEATDRPQFFNAPVPAGGAYETSKRTAPPIGPSHSEGGRGTIDPASVTRVFTSRNTGRQKQGAAACFRPSAVASMFPNAEFVAVRLADDAETGCSP